MKESEPLLIKFVFHVMGIIVCFLEYKFSMWLFNDFEMALIIFLSWMWTEINWKFYELRKKI